LAEAVSAACPAVTDDGETSVNWVAYRRCLTAVGYGVALAVPVGLDRPSTCALVFLGPEGFEFTPELVGGAE
jgi:hypothetical protein